MRRIRVFIVDDHSLVREGLKMLVGTCPDTELVGQAASGKEAVPAIARCAPDVVLLDLDLGDEDGVALLPRITEAAPAVKVLVVTGLRDVERQHQAILAGARGLVPKDRSPEVLVKAIRRVDAGELWFERELVHAALRRATPAATPLDAEAARIASLTAREREVVALLGEGLKNEQIAQRLSISEKTVRNHLSSVFDKLGVSDRLELLVFAYRRGLVRAPVGHR
jgi:DNA-binding NarL/FixJ family response regulator